MFIIYVGGEVPLLGEDESNFDRSKNICFVEQYSTAIFTVVYCGEVSNKIKPFAKAGLFFVTYVLLQIEILVLEFSDNLSEKIGCDIVGLAGSQSIYAREH